MEPTIAKAALDAFLQYGAHLPTCVGGDGNRCDCGYLQAWEQISGANPRPLMADVPVSGWRSLIEREWIQQAAYAASNAPSAGLTTPNMHRQSAAVLRLMLTLGDFYDVQGWPAQEVS